MSSARATPGPACSTRASRVCDSGSIPRRRISSVKEVRRPAVLARLRDERAAARDALEQTLGDEGVERLSYGHPGHAETSHQLALGRCRGPGRLGLDEAADVLTDLDMLQRPLPRHDEVHLIHTCQARTGLDRRPRN